MNFTIILKEFSFDSWPKVVLMSLGLVTYIYFILSAILEPIKPLRQLSEEELNDHEFKKIIICAQE